jgi:hypothetical protein
MRVSGSDANDQQDDGQRNEPKRYTEHNGFRVAWT